jgi:transposase
MSPDAICGLLAEPDRLAAFSAVVLGAGTTDEIANRTGLGRRDVISALRRLSAGGLVHPVEAGGARTQSAAFDKQQRDGG